MPACKICQAQTSHFAEYRILGKYPAEYRRCGACGYVFILEPHWLEEAYSTAIAALDTGIVVRNRWLTDALTVLQRCSFPATRRALDVGGGSGLLVRSMRDRGFDWWWSDRYCPNLLARGFEAPPQSRFDLVGAFEVIEHLDEPAAFFDELDRLGDAFVIATELLPANQPKPGDWWYYTPETGQHIGFFTRRSLDILGERHGRVLSSNGRNLHVLAKTKISEPLLRFLRKPGRARLLGPMLAGKSLANADAARLQEQLRND